MVRKALLRSSFLQGFRQAEPALSGATFVLFYNSQRFGVVIERAEHKKCGMPYFQFFYF
jgi:hypothetical protein